MLCKKAAFVSASEERLEKLIVKRISASEEEKREIDKQIWDLFGEKLAIMLTDLSGFSRHTAKFGITHFLQTIYESERILTPLIERHNGILIKTEGDSMLVIFKNPNNALECAINMQKEVKKYNQGKSDEEKVLLCIGLGYGEVLKIGDSDIFGYEVNLASKLGEDIAKSYEILATENFVKHINVDFVKTEMLDDKIFGEIGKGYKIIYN
ncbi:MAG: adenylate/guanylate cyclase domain-containing protein [Deltaproteobacteria bacterium]|nr:adenylate/guanylate cyclase domain-containing protein [Deltaproteobacteria bacterium]